MTVRTGGTMQQKNGDNSFFASLAGDVLSVVKDAGLRKIDSEIGGHPVWTANATAQHRQSYLRDPTYVGANARPRMDQNIGFANDTNAPPTAKPALFDLNLGGTRIDGTTLAIVAASIAFVAWAVFVK